MKLTRILNYIIVFVLLLLWTSTYAQVQIKSDNKLDWKASGFDVAGNFMGGSEIMNIVSYKGKLYAGNGFFQDGSVDYNASYYKGAHVMVKETASSPWKTSHSFGRDYVRIESLNAFKISIAPGLYQDILLASPSDWSTTSLTRTASVFILDDVGNTGWIKSEIKSFSSSEPGVGARSAIIYKDKITGQEYLFAGISTGVQGGLIFKGKVIQTNPVKFEFDTVAELNQLGRPSSFAVCNNDLYSLSGLHKDTITGQITGGLYKRIDGEHPSWELVYQWSWNSSSIVVAADEKNLARGLTTVKSLKSSGEALILGRASDGVVERIEPMEAYKVYTEINLRNYFKTFWGLTSYGALNPCVIAHNRFQKVNNYLLFDVWVEHPDYKTRDTNYSFVMVRDTTGIYKGHISFYDPAHYVAPKGRWSGSRTISLSPFAEDNVDYPTIYVGGHDAVVTADSTAWIYKIQLTDDLFKQSITSIRNFNYEIDNFSIFPNPVTDGNVMVQYGCAADEKIALGLIDAQGQVVKEWQFDVTQGINKCNLPLHGLQPGIYIIQATAAGLHRKQKIAVQ